MSSRPVYRNRHDTRFAGNSASRAIKRIPMKCIGEPEDIAETICFLASDAARILQERPSGKWRIVYAMRGQSE